MGKNLLPIILGIVVVIVIGLGIYQLSQEDDSGDSDILGEEVVSPEANPVPPAPEAPETDLVATEAPLALEAATALPTESPLDGPTPAATDAHPPMEEWETITGEVIAYATGIAQVQHNDGTLIEMQVGQETFWAEQGFTLTVGDQVEARGFYQNTQFQVGILMNLTTGQTILLRDPNGRPLWAGPGRSSGQGGNGQGGQGQGNQTTTSGTPSQGGQGQGGNGQGGNGQGQGNLTTTPHTPSASGQGGNGQGNQYRGGRNQTPTATP